MRRKSKSKAELGSFSASAIDLFASALGAFIIITVVLFPYFPNLSPDPLKIIIEQLRKDKKGLEDQVADLSDQNAALSDQNNTLTAKNSVLTNTNTALTSQNASQASKIKQQQGTINSANAQSSNQSQQIADLKNQLDGIAFIGVEPKERKFQLIFDMSGSIGPDANSPGYVSQVRNIASTILNRLGKQDSLRVMTYQGPVGSPDIGIWPNNGGFVNNVSGSDKTSAQNFVNSALQNTGGYTPTFKALEKALSENQPTTIMIVTDGIPQILSGDGAEGASRNTIEQAVQTATMQNSGRHQINIIAIGDFVTSQKTSAIVPLATRNNGVLVAMP